MLKSNEISSEVIKKIIDEKDSIEKKLQQEQKHNSLLKVNIEILEKDFMTLKDQSNRKIVILNEKNKSLNNNIEKLKIKLNDLEEENDSLNNDNR